MQKIVIFTALVTFSLQGYVDLGEMGTTHTIIEKSILKQLKEGMKKLRTKDFRERAYQEIEKAKTVNADIPVCVADAEYQRGYEYEYLYDAIDIDGNIIHQVGNKITSFSPRTKTLCIIDGSSEARMMYSIGRLREEGGCTKTLVANTSVDKAKGLSKELGMLYPYHHALTAALNISCYPSKVIISGSKMIYKEYGIEQ